VLSKTKCGGALVDFVVAVVEILIIKGRMNASEFPVA
jgi:hypothetical protein